MRKRLKPIPPRTGPLWCGPAALMAVTGCNKYRAEAAIRKTRRTAHESGESERKGDWVAGVTQLELVGALWLLGCHVRVEPRRVTLARWLRERESKEMCIVELTKHFIAVAGDRWVDNNHRNRTWLLEKCDRRRCMLRAVIWVT